MEAAEQSRGVGVFRSRLRDDARRRAMQQRGRGGFMAEYRIQGCRPERVSAFHKEG